MKELIIIVYYSYFLVTKNVKMIKMYQYINKHYYNWRHESIQIIININFCTFKYKIKKNLIA